MKFSEYWDHLVFRNPKLNDDYIIKLNVREFKNWLESSYNEGIKEATVESQVSTYEKIFGTPKKESNHISFIEHIFGKWQ